MMKALRLHTAGLDGIHYEEVPELRPAAAEVLVRVHAAGISPNELDWWTRPEAGRTLPMIPGYEFSGVVFETEPGVSGWKPGDAVYARTRGSRDGAQAEYALVDADVLAPLPSSLDHIQAAAIPLGCLTSWQALFDYGHLLAGQTVLIHGGAGGVGVYAVQLAHRFGARVLTTASGRHAEFLQSLGADQVIDYTRTPFENVVRDVDIVFDMIGGQTLERSWQVLRRGGVLVTVASGIDTGLLESKAPEYGVHAHYFIARPSAAQLEKVSALIDRGELKPVVSAVYPLSQGRSAYEHARAGHMRGKIILEVLRDD